MHNTKTVEFWRRKSKDNTKQIEDEHVVEKTIWHNETEKTLYMSSVDTVANQSKAL